ncbi:DUF1828 domain-containing protein [Gemella bergeri]
MINITEIKEEYMNYISKNTHMNLLAGDSYEVNTLYTNAYGDGISFTIKYDGNHYILTDDGFTLWELQLNGIDLTKKNKRYQLLKSILNYNGLELSGEEIIKKTKRQNLGQAIHDMTQVLLNVYDLSLLHPQTVQSHFLDDVRGYFDGNADYNVFPDLSITGKSRIEHKFNFLMMSKGKYKLVQVHNKITKDKLHFILASWLDTTENRIKSYGRNESLSIIISPDGYQELKEEYQEALSEYDINIINFEDKKKLKTQLGA